MGVFLATGCAHELEIQQGNVVTQKKLARLEVGMESAQVRYLLGSPVIQDPFQPNRWDYVFTLKSAEQGDQAYRLSLFFEEEKLVRIEQKGEFPEKEFPYEEEE